MAGLVGGETGDHRGAFGIRGHGGAHLAEGTFEAVYEPFTVGAIIGDNFAADALMAGVEAAPATVEGMDQFMVDGAFDFGSFGEI